MSLYSPDIVYFDVVPPLRTPALPRFAGDSRSGSMATRAYLLLTATTCKIVASGDLAVAWWLSRERGTLKNGREVGSWVRATSCCHRSNDNWLITHEHISLPVDLKSGSAMTDFDPDPTRCSLSSVAVD